FHFSFLWLASSLLLHCFLLSAYREELDCTVLPNLITISYKLAKIAADAVPEQLNFGM
ncbi:unnamed protein product, partial [Prunus brigantina]